MAKTGARIPRIAMYAITSDGDNVMKRCTRRPCLWAGAAISAMILGAIAVTGAARADTTGMGPPIMALGTGQLLNGGQLSHSRKFSSGGQFANSGQFFHGRKFSNDVLFANSGQFSHSRKFSNSGQFSSIHALQLNGRTIRVGGGLAMAIMGANQRALLATGEAEERAEFAIGQASLNAEREQALARQRAVFAAGQSRLNAELAVGEARLSARAAQAEAVLAAGQARLASQVVAQGNVTNTEASANGGGVGVGIAHGAPRKK